MFSLVTHAIERAVSCLWREIGKRGWEKHSGEKCRRLAPHTGTFLKFKSFQKQWRRQNKLFPWKKDLLGIRRGSVERGGSSEAGTIECSKYAVLLPLDSGAADLRSEPGPHVFVSMKHTGPVVVFVIIPLYFCL